MNSNSENHSLKKKSLNLPDNPGVYIMKDKNLNIIYVGKAKNLKNRVTQYFTHNSNHTEKVLTMVSHINDFEYIITSNEYEALVLECNLIKKHTPKYNILLKDDKGYSYIKITDETWPKIIMTNKKNNDNCRYIGPFMSSLSAQSTLEEVVKVFKLPTCKKSFHKISRPCLNYYINICTAPCRGKISLDEYLNDIKMAYSLLKNGCKKELKILKKKMIDASDNLQFEKAAKIRDRIKALESVSKKQKIILDNNINCDFVAFTHDKQQVSMNVLKFIKGVLCECENFIFTINNNINDTRLELIENYYITTNIVPNKIIINVEIIGLEALCKWLQKNNNDITINAPRTNQEIEIMEMCRKNSYEGLIRSENNQDRQRKILSDLRYILCLKTDPNYIEAYDISNIKDTQKVGGLVVFKDGRPLKSAYRKFKIKTVHGQDDYASILEIIKRRFDRYLKESDNNLFNIRPDLILIDGGIGHTRKVIEYLRSIKLDSIPVFGMVKDTRHRTKAITNGINEIDIKSKIDVFNFITAIQDEVHRFTINYHKKNRSKEFKILKLEQIPGIGKKRSQALLKRFKSIERLSKVSLEELSTIPGIPLSVATSIVEYFKGTS